MWQVAHPASPGWVAKRTPLAFALLLNETFDQLLAPALLTLDSLAQFAVHLALLVARAAR